MKNISLVWKIFSDKVLMLMSIKVRSLKLDKKLLLKSLTKDFLLTATMSKIFSLKSKLWKKLTIQILLNFMIFIKLPTICTLSLNFVKMVTFMDFYKKSAKLKKNKQKLILDKLWKESNICIQMASFIETWSQQIFWWKMGNVKLVILVLLKIFRIKILSWNPSSVLLFICLHNFLKKLNIRTNQIFGQLVWFIMKCYMEEHHGQLQMSFNFWMEFIQKNLLFTLLFHPFLKISS